MGWFRDWAELLGLIIMVIGFLIAASLGSAVMLYIIIFITGLIFGRFWFKMGKDIRFPWFLVIFFFLIGFVVGSFYGNNAVIILLFILGMVVSYYLHSRKFVSSEEY